ncbi:MAG: LysE family translocator [Allosphingosinicella sp.]|uniref:LysE family translocator n=1 Tax=Allosphingosinicella sp. TaxID=2823234 RepID=UPI0039263FFE
MTLAAFLSLVTFSFAMAITPGPNNLLLTTSGVAYGFRGTIPAIAGTLMGICGLFLVSGAGVGALVAADARAQAILRLVGAAYLMFLAWRLWRAAELAETEPTPPLRLWHVAGFQFVNPKAWMMSVSAVSIYVAAGEGYALRLLSVAAIFITVAAPCAVLWAGFGAGMRRALRDPVRLRLFNRSMAVLTAASAMLVLLW